MDFWCDNKQSDIVPDGHDYFNENCSCSDCCARNEQFHSYYRISELQRNLYQQCVEKSSFCDTIIHTGTKEVKAHSCVLVTCPYFKRAFSFGEKKDHIDLSSDCNEEVMEGFIKFLYTDQVTLTKDNVQLYLKVADFLQFPRLTHQCLQFLQSTKLTLDNCVQIMLLYSQYDTDPDSLYFKQSLRYLKGHLPELMMGHQLLALDTDSVLSFITDPTLSYVSREDLFNFIVRWTEKDEINRNHLFQKLFLALDLSLVSWSFLTCTIADNTLVHRFIECMRHYRQTCNRGVASRNEKGISEMDVVVVGGGLEDGSKCLKISNKVMAYIVQEKRWAHLPDMPLPLMSPVMCFTNEGQLLVVDSCSTNNQASGAFLFCPRQNNWIVLQVKYPDKEIFEHHALVSSGGLLFFVTTCTISKIPYVKLYEVIWHKSPKPDDDVAGCISLGFVCSFFEGLPGVDTCIKVACSPSPDLSSGLICVLMCQCEITKVSIYDVGTQSVSCVVSLSVDLAGTSFNLPLAQGVLVCLNKAKAVMMLRDSRRAAPEVPLPPFDGGVEPEQLGKHFSSICVGDHLYVFGGEMWHSCKRYAARFSFSEQRWTVLEKMPCGLAWAGVAWGTLGSDVLRCHANCPHCTLLKTSATEEEEEEPPDYDRKL